MARPIEFPDLGTLWSRADLVVVIVPTNTVKSPDRFPQKGEAVLIEHPEACQGFNTTCTVQCVFKRGGTSTKFNAGSLSLLHFGYAKPQLPFNGALFMYFELPPAWHVVSVARNENNGPTRVDPAWIASSKLPTYLAFLKKREDGRYEPVTGHYDAALSFRVLAEVLESYMRHNHKALSTSAPPAVPSVPK